MEWISVKTRLPEALVTVLLVYKDKFGKEQLTGYWDDSNRCFIQNSIQFLPPEPYLMCADYLTHKKKEITHWMPLPAPPEHIPDAGKMV